MPSARALRGFTLLESLVALALLATSLLLGLALYAQQRRIEHRLAAQRDADRALASVLEAARAGLLLPTSGPLDSMRFAGSAAPPPALSLEAEPDSSDPLGQLWHVRAVAVYSVDGQPFRRTIDTLVWQP